MQNSVLQWMSSKVLERRLQPRELLTARKFVYVFLILVLFTGSVFWRRSMVDARAVELAIRPDSQGEVELSGEIIRLSLTGFRGVVTCVLWNQALDKQLKNQWNELEFLVHSLAKLQPHFITTWLFQSWNLSYNVSVEADRVGDKYFFIARGIDLLCEGERQNQNNPKMRQSVGFYLAHKICQSDQTNVLRSLFQLSIIPPNERDPDRFIKRSADGREEIDWKEFEKFVTKYPQLARRLHAGQVRDNRDEYRNQFTCRDVDEVIRFLRDQWRVPSIYVIPEKREGSWEQKADKLLPPEARFPPLPPPHTPPSPQHFYQPAPDFTELTTSSPLDDTIDGFCIARAWYGYAQEPLPDPGPMPGSSKQIVDRVHQRLPGMTTMLFRIQPALAQSAVATRLQQEGWFRPDAAEEEKARREGRAAEEYWQFPDDGWFRPRNNRMTNGTKARLVLQPSQHADVVWKAAHDMWIKTGEENHLVFPSQEKEAETISLAARYCNRMGVEVGKRVPPPPGGPDNLPPEEREEFEAGVYLFEYNSYRTMCNFPHHYYRSKIESDKTAIACRKLFFEADMAYIHGDSKRAQDLLEKPVAFGAWRDDVLLAVTRTPDRRLEPTGDPATRYAHRMFRQDQATHEFNYETQLRYLQIINENYGVKIKKDIGRKWSLMAVGAAPLPAGAGPGGAAFSLFVAAAVDKEWNPPPMGTAYADLRGPLSLNVFDVEQKDQPRLAAAMIGAGCTPLAPTPLLMLDAAGAWTEPLINSSAYEVVRERKRLVPPKPAPPRPNKQKPR